MGLDGVSKDVAVLTLIEKKLPLTSTQVISFISVNQLLSSRLYFTKDFKFTTSYIAQVMRFIHPIQGKSTLPFSKSNNRVFQAHRKTQINPEWFILEMRLLHFEFI